MPGRSMVGRESLKLVHERSIRSPAAKIRFELKVRVVAKVTVTSLARNKPYLIVPSSCCEVIQLARIAGSDPVHAGSNPALAAKVLRSVAGSSG